MHSGTDITPAHLNDVLGKFLPELKDIVQLPSHNTLDHSYMLLSELKETFVQPPESSLESCGSIGQHDIYD